MSTVSRMNRFHPVHRNSLNNNRYPAFIFYKLVQLSHCNLFKFAV
jgi:hypothetical protein